MKSVTTKVSIGSDQVKQELREQLMLDAIKLSVYPTTSPVFTKDGRKTVELGEITVSVPENQDDVLALLARDAATVIKTLGTQLVTNAANEYRKSFTKEGDAKLKQANRDRVVAWLFGPVGQQYSAEFIALPAGNAKVRNDWLDQKFAEHLADTGL